MLKELYKKYKEVINYLIFGFLTTFISLLSYFVCVNLFLDANNPVELQIANVISWLIAVTFAYITNKKYVFDKTSKNVVNEIFQFYSSRVLSLIVDMFLMFLFVSIFQFNSNIVKLFVQLVIIILNYVLSKCIVFRE